MIPSDRAFSAADTSNHYIRIRVATSIDRTSCLQEGEVKKKVPRKPALFLLLAFDSTPTGPGYDLWDWFTGKALLPALSVVSDIALSCPLMNVIM